MNDLLAKPNISLKKALKILGQTGKKCIVIVDDKKRLLGTLTDGDLRGSILSGKNINESIAKIYNSKPTFFVDKNYSFKEARKFFLENRFDLIPIVNKKNQVIRIVFWDQVLKSQKKSEGKKVKASVIIMAGGKGKRLEPFTKILPKPLIPISGKAIIEHIIDKFVQMGAKNFYISTNYKSKLLQAYFKEVKTKKYNIKYIEEKKPLGTVGSLNFLRNKFDKPIILTNSDILINTDLADIYAFHEKKRYDVTLVASSKDFTIPYGVCQIDNKGYLKNLVEKPTYNFLVNTGLYILNPKVLKLIPKNKLYDITDLIMAVKKAKMKIGAYPISDESWIDVGQWTEYKEATKKLSSY